MNRHARRALEAKTRKPNQAVQAAVQQIKGLGALPETLKEVQDILAGVTAMQMNLAQALRNVAALEYRLARQEHVFTQMLDGAYRNLGTTFGARLNEPVPYIEWNSRRIVLEKEYDRQHMEAAPEEPATET
jgi:hypothetical protein